MPSLGGPRSNMADDFITGVIILLVLVIAIALPIIYFTAPKAEATPTPAETYTPPDSCGLEVVECPQEEKQPEFKTPQDYEEHVTAEIKETCDKYPAEPCMGLVTIETSLVIEAISRVETASGTTGVGRSKNNPTGIKCGGTYCSYESLEAGQQASMDLWQKRYADLPLDDALAKWKTGNSKDRSPATVAYISLVGGLITQ